jgi:hypothetical protein
VARKFKRGAKGTDLGGQFIGAKSVAHFLAKMLTPAASAKQDRDLKSRVPGPPSKALGRVMAAHSLPHGGERAHKRDIADVAHLRAQADVLDARRTGPKRPGDPLLDAGNRRANMDAAARTRAQADQVQARVDMREGIKADSAATYGDTEAPKTTVAEARAAVERLQAKASGGRAARKMAAARRAPAVPEAPKANPLAAGGAPVQADDAIRQAYLDAGHKTGDWMSVADVRDAMSAKGFDHAQQDAALARLLGGEGQGRPYLIPSVVPHTLTQRERDAALHAGGEDNHLLMFRETPKTSGPAGTAPNPDGLDSMPDHIDDAQSAPGPGIQTHTGAAAKMARAKAPKADHATTVADIRAASSGDEVRRILADRKHTVAELRAISAEVSPSASTKGTKAQLIDNIAAGSTLSSRPAAGFAGTWADGKAAPAAPQAPPTPRYRKQDGRPDGMRPEHGAGVFAQGEAGDKIRSDLGIDYAAPKKTAAQKMARAKAAPTAPTAPTVDPGNVTHPVGDGITPTVRGIPGRAASDAWGSLADPRNVYSDERKAEVQSAIRAEYAKLVDRPGGYVHLLDLRAALGNRYPRQEIDDNLLMLNRQPDVTVVNEANQKAHTPQTRAAVIIGGQDKHAIRIAPAPPSAAKKAVPAAGAPMSPAATPSAALIQRLNGLYSRQDAAAAVADIKTPDLRAIGKALNIPRSSGMRVADLRREIVDATVGRRLDSIATRGFTGLRP